MKKYILWITTILIFCYAKISAQIIQPIPVVHVQNLNTDSLLKIYSCDTCYKSIFGKTVSMNLSKEAGIWEFKDQTWQWSITLKSETAQGLGLLLTEIEKEYLDLTFTNEFKETSKFSNQFNGRYFSSILTGKEITINYKTLIKEELPFTISGLIHVFDINKYTMSLKTNATCDYYGVNCAPSRREFCNQIRSVVKIIMKDCNNDWYQCSGALVNNCNNDFTPYILTAAHCTNDPAICSFTDYKFIFNYQEKICYNSLSTPQGNEDMEVYGATVEKYNSGSLGPDMSILRMSQKPPLGFNVYYSGWKDIDDGPLEVAGIHHPHGNTKKAAYGLATTNIWPLNQFWDVNFGTNCVQGGSSGSPLFERESKKIIGVCSFQIPWWVNAFSFFISPGLFLAPTNPMYGQFHHFKPTINTLFNCGANTASISGIDPITSCQNNVDVYGDLYPGWDWQERNAITIQASNHITTFSSVRLNITPYNARMGAPNKSDYTFRAGQSIRLMPGFKVFADNHFLAQNGPCLQEGECGINFKSIEADWVYKPYVKEHVTSMVDDIKIYPNPVIDHLVYLDFDLVNRKNVTIRLYDVTGKFIQTIDKEQVLNEKLVIDINRDVIQSSTILLTIESNGVFIKTEKLILKNE